MAHAAHLSQLADSLITSILVGKGSDAEARQVHDRTLRGLTNSTHARTNQFDVQSRLAGLVEKFAVLNRDELAEGLQIRLAELPTESKWLPEMLSLLLELSDRPLEKTRIEDVEAASKLDEVESALTWADIIADEPLNEAGIWDDVERGYHSSDDDFTADEDGSGDETQATSVGEDDPVALARMHVMQVEDEALAEVIDAYKAMGSVVPAPAEPVSELVLIRETLSVLHGLPASLFDKDDTDGSLSPSENVKLDTASKSVLHHALQALAFIGSSLNALRIWTRSEQHAPVVRSCQSVLTSQLKTLSFELANIEQRYITPGANGTSSIVQLRADIGRLTHPFVSLAKLLQEDGKDASNTSTLLLDNLYDQACVAQLSGDVRTFDSITRMLMAGLNTHLRPVAKWISGGECNKNHDFFVVEEEEDCELSRLWHDRYALRQQANTELAAPVFMRPFVSRIFALGKGRAFLRALNGEEDGGEAGHASPGITLHTSDTTLSPFSQVLADALETWIMNQSKDQTPVLRKSILQDHGLLTTVDALQHVFFSKNGRRFQTFADTLFWRLDHGARWQDGFLLTELAQTTVGSELFVTSESITIQIADVDSDNQGSASRSSSIRRLQNLHLQYYLPWPLQNITATAHSTTYSRAFTFLLQIFRAKYLMRQQILSLRSFNDYTTELSPRVQSALKLQQRLSTIVDIFHAHVTHTSDVLSARLKNELHGAAGIDDMAAVWRDHEKVLGMSLLVAEKLGPVRDAGIALLETCERLMEILEQLGAARAPDGSETNGNADERVDEGGVNEMAKEADRSLSLITAGLRGIARAGGNAAVEELAERLEWAVH